jgi:hypothetical protein
VTSNTTEGEDVPENRAVAVLVDAYTSARYLAPEFIAVGADVVHVQGTPELMSSMPAPDLSVYRANVIHEGMDRTVERLARYSPVCVIAGQEPGVLLADELSRRLGLPTTNEPALSLARRDKYEMTEAVRAAGLHCASQFKSADPAALAGWAERAGAYPVVVKPLRSAASDSVFICIGADEVRAAAQAVLASETIYQENNREALVQSYLPGNEYVVDMVSYEGSRYVCGVWEYQKRILPAGRSIYDREYLLPARESPAAELIVYVDKALDALGVSFGPTHAEIMNTPDGPAMVEIGSRIAGNIHPRFHDACAGANQATLTALAYLDPGRFLREYGAHEYTKRCEAVCYTTATTLSGVVDSIDDAVVDEISRLETVFTLDVKIRPGERIRPTVDLYSSTMRVFLRGPDRDAVRRDYERIEELKDHVYRIRDDKRG